MRLDYLLTGLAILLCVASIMALLRVADAIDAHARIVDRQRQAYMSRCEETCKPYFLADREPPNYTGSCLCDKGIEVR
jgi:hypothetical protein